MFERLFGLKKNGTTVRMEIVAGIMAQSGVPAGGVKSIGSFTFCP